MPYAYLWFKWDDEMHAPVNGPLPARHASVDDDESPIGRLLLGLVVLLDGAIFVGAVVYIALLLILS